MVLWGMLGQRTRRPRGRPSKGRRYDTASQKEYYNSITDVRDLSPRVRMGLRLYAHTAVNTKKEAAAAAGLSIPHLTNISNSPAGLKFMESIDNAINDRSLSTSQLIEKLGRRAVEVIGQSMEHASSEALRLKAAIDLADRAPETSKIQRHQVESFTVRPEDARAIAESMVQAAAVRKRYAPEVQGNFDKVGMDAIAEGTDNETVETPQSLLPILDAEDSLGNDQS